jgi:hypothetical protein
MTHYDPKRKIPATGKKRRQADYQSYQNAGGTKRYVARITKHSSKDFM